MRQKYRICEVVFILLFGFLLSAAGDLPSVSAAKLLMNKKAFHGRVISVDGLVRFDRLSQRGFLYQNLRDMGNRDYRRTIFLELGNENFSSLKIPDGTHVVVTGYLSKELRGPLGVYAGHIIVDRIQVLTEKSRNSKAGN